MNTHEVPPTQLETHRYRPTPAWCGGGRFRWLAAGAVALTLAVTLAPGRDALRAEASPDPAVAGRALGDAAASVLAAGESRLVRMSAPTSPLAVRLGWKPDGTGFLDGSVLPALPPDRTYQLWAVVGSERVSVGVLGHRPGVVPFAARIPALRGFSLTDEPARGAGASVSAPLAYAHLRRPPG